MTKANLSLCLSSTQ